MPRHPGPGPSHGDIARSILSGLIPGLDLMSDAYTVVKGEDLFTGDSGSRALAGLGLAAPWLGAGALRGLRSLKKARQASKLLKGLPEGAPADLSLILNLPVARRPLGLSLYSKAPEKLPNGMLRYQGGVFNPGDRILRLNLDSKSREALARLSQAKGYSTTVPHELKHSWLSGEQTISELGRRFSRTQQMLDLIPEAYLRSSEYLAEPGALIHEAVAHQQGIDRISELRAILQKVQRRSGGPEDLRALISRANRAVQGVPYVPTEALMVGAGGSFLLGALGGSEE